MSARDSMMTGWVVLVAAGALWAAAPSAVQVRDTDAGDLLVFSPGWTAWKGQGPRGGTLHYANQAGQTARFTFVGTEVCLVHKAGSDCGIARVTIDGKPFDGKTGEIDTHLAGVDWGRRTPLARGLAATEHTVVVEVTGRRRDASSNTYVQIVGFDVDDAGWHARRAEAERRRADAERAEAALSQRRLRDAAGRCGPIAFVKRHHFRNPGAGGVMLCWDIYSPGGGIYTWDPARPDTPPREIFASPGGVVYDMSLSRDGKSILFAWMDLSLPGADSFHIYRIGLDGSGLRQLTDGRFHDASPVELPDGRIAFVSTRSSSFSMCQDAASSSLHVMDADGRNLRRIQFGTLADMSPFVLDDGRILFTRWEYQDKSVFTVQSLWTIHPDGTQLALYYGNTITIPNTIWQAKPIPGTDQVLCTLAPHHREQVGAIGVVDQRLGLENPQSLTNLTPDVPYVPSTDPKWFPGDRLFYWSYRDPFPVERDLFLVSYGGPEEGGPKRYRLFVMDERGRKAPLLEDGQLSCFNAIPLRARKAGHVLPPLEPGARGHGTFLVSDVYVGLRGVPRGTVKALRVMSQVARPTNNRGRRAFFNGHDIVDPVIGAGTFYVKYNYGTVPVEADGSACFQAPAGVELYFQALDADGMEVSRMGSLTQVMPGEHQTCIGCHEDRVMTPPARAGVPLAARRPAWSIQPPAWGAGPVDFVRHVQPVLDRRCAGCHSGTNPPKGVDLSGDKTRHFNMAYDHLVRPHRVQFFYLTPPGEMTGSFQPMQTGSHASSVVRMIRAGHQKVKLEADELARLCTWIDANVPYYSTYEHTRPGTAGSRDAWAGEWFKEFAAVYDRRCAACHERSADLNDRQAWINLTRPAFSRVLNAPLSKSAGGLELCRPKGGRVPSLFADRSDADYGRLLAAIQRGAQDLLDRPRMDMPGGVGVPYERDFGRLFQGGGRYVGAK